MSAWNVGLGISFSAQFANCVGLTTLDVTNWDVGSGTNFNSQFINCTGL